MTDSAPIVVDKELKAGVVLVDLENVRLSWRKTFNRTLQYEDLRMLCDILENQINPVFSTNDAINCLRAASSSNPNFPKAMSNVNHVLCSRLTTTPCEGETEYIELNDTDDENDSCQSEKEGVSSNVHFVLSSLVVFMSDPAEFRLVCLRQHPAQLTSAHQQQNNNTAIDPGKGTNERYNGHSGPGNPMLPSDKTWDIEEYEAMARIHRLLKRDAEKTKDINRHRSPDTEAGSDSDVVCEDAEPPPPPKFKVEVKTFGYKKDGSRGRVVQKACDVAVGSACTKVCFMPNIDMIVLISADSDFEEAAKECLRSEDCGGVIKFKKQIVVTAFSSGFVLSKRRLARHQKLMRHHFNTYCIALSKNAQQGFLMNQASMTYPFSSFAAANSFQQRARKLLSNYRNIIELDSSITQDVGDDASVKDSVEYFLLDEDFRESFRQAGMVQTANFRNNPNTANYIMDDKLVESRKRKRIPCEPVVYRSSSCSPVLLLEPQDTVENPQQKEYGEISKEINKEIYIFKTDNLYETFSDVTEESDNEEHNHNQLLYHHLNRPSTTT